MNSAPGSVQRLIYRSAATTFGKVFEKSTKAELSIISAILSPQSQIKTAILGVSSSI
jgi:hypothetical protein